MSGERRSGGSAFQTTRAAMEKLRWPTDVFARKTNRSPRPADWSDHFHCVTGVAAQSPSCDCGQRRTMNHIVDTCPLTEFEGGLNLLRIRVLPPRGYTVCVFVLFIISLASLKSRMVLLFWYQFSCVVLEKRPLNGCSSSNSSM